MNRDSSTGFFAGLIVGAMIGAAVGLLYAPQPGSETRRMVKEKAIEVKDKAAGSCQTYEGCRIEQNGRPGIIEPLRMHHDANGRSTS